MEIMTNLTAYDEAQNGLISSLLYLPGRVKDVIDLITEDDFEDGRLKTIWKAIVDLDHHDRPIDYANILSDIHMHDALAQAGGVEEVQRLFNDGALNASMGTVEIYAQVVKNESAKRNLTPIFEDLSTKVKHSGGNAKKLIETGRKALDGELLKLANESNVVNVSDYFDDYTKNLSDKMDLYKKFGDNPIAAQKGIPAGFPTIDRYVGGFLPGQVITIGARTGIGKSFLLADLALNAAHANAPVLFFNLEMLPSEVMNRIVAANSNVRLSALKNGSLSDEEYQKVMASAEEIKSLPIVLDSTPNITIDHIRARAQQMASSETGLGIIVIDYLQLISASAGSHRSSREEELADISRGIKLLSMQLKVPIVQATMVNRLAKGEEDAMPRRDDIRGTNQIAMDSSVVILIHRTKSEAKTDSDATFVIDKNRNGKDGIFFKCHTLLKYAKFVEVTEQVDGDLDDHDERESSGPDGDPDGESRIEQNDPPQDESNDNDHDSEIDDSDMDVFDDEEDF
jgi:replicative DNA helicase